jgi:NAD(P)-dependent dehydrogenase (short-subunit alcohol dehydrogenase family)/acyl carrier protein
MARSVLVTGGNRGIGLAIARRLAAGGDRVTVTSRSGEQVEGLATVACDVRDMASVEEAFAKVEADQGPVEVLIANAGVTHDQLLALMSEDAFTSVLDTNLTGAYRVAKRAVRPMMRLRHGRLIFISSVVGLLGSAGQANYAAANGYLDGLAERLRAEDVPAVSVSWGPWVPRSGAGLAGTDAVAKAVGRLGLRPLTDETAAPALELAVNGGPARLVAVDMDVAAYCQAVGGHPRAALVAGLLPASGGAQGAPEQGGGSALPLGWLRAQLDGADPQETLREAIRAVVVEALGESVEVDDHAGFSELGLDSIMVIDLRARLSHALDYDLPATVAIDHPTVAALARHIAETLAVAQRPAAAAPAATATPTEDRAPAATPVPEPARQSDDPSDLSLEELLMTVQHDLSTGV